MPTIHLIIEGKVQGVFFRATARDVAEELGITGWIRNTEEGTVEATLSGAREQLNEFVKWSKKGPERAVVTDVKVTEKEEEKFESFRVIRGE